jgi:nickel-dependent lactate racemase
VIEPTGDQMPWFSVEAPSITARQIEDCVDRLISEAQQRLNRELKRVLLLPPDLTRAHSGAGRITELLYKALPDAHIEVIPTLGQHLPHTEAENKWMFGSIPNQQIFPHDWRNGCVRLGTIPASLVKETTAGAADWEFQADRGDLGPDHQHRACSAARGARLRQPQ